MTGDPTLRRLRRMRREISKDNVGSLHYTIYVVLMLALIVGVPVIRMAVLGLASPEALVFLNSSLTPTVLATITGLLFAGMIVLGGLRGPALVDPFHTVVVVGNHLPRRRTLRRPFLLSLASVVAILAALALVLASALAVAGRAAAVSAIVFVAATVLVGVVASILWLVGQSTSARFCRAFAALISVASIVLAVVPGGLLAVPWGWFALLYPSTNTVAWPALAALTTVVVLAALAVPKLLDGTRGPELLAQAQRWNSVATFTATADVAGALAQLRALPGLGRNWIAVRNAPLPVVMFVRDCVGSLRSPVRPAAAALSLAVSGFLLTSTAITPAAIAWVPALVGAMIAYLALGVWSDGFRHAADTTGEIPLYGFGVGKQFALHATLPIVGVIVFAGGGALAAIATGATIASAAVAIAFTLFIITIRILDATKGRMPLELLAPVSTPAGDFSGALVVLWQADTLLLVSILSLLLTASWLSTPVLLGILPIAGVIVLILARRNLAHDR